MHSLFYIAIEISLDKRFVYQYDSQCNVGYTVPHLLILGVPSAAGKDDDRTVGWLGVEVRPLWLQLFAAS